jgi:hydroxyacylglutathione hydrolase
MILRQFLHADPVAASYLFGCGGKASAAVVDPLGDVAPYLRAAEATGMRIRYVVDTHLHADHLSAGRTLANEAGAEYVLFAEANATFPFRGVRDGDVLEFGNVSIKVLHTPGHTPELGDLGRTEFATSAEDGARALFESIQKLKSLPDYLEVLPGAYSGSVCGRNLSGKPTSTIGFEKRYNKAFRIDDEDTFLRAMLADVPPAPPQAAQVRAVNSGAMATAE